MSKTNYLENRVLNAVFRNTALQIATVYVALHTADPGETGATAEATGANGVARVVGTFGTDAAGGSIANTADIVFAAATGDLGTITHVSVWDTARASGAAQAGNCLWSGALTTPQAVPAGVAFRLPTGDLVINDD